MPEEHLCSQMVKQLKYLGEKKKKEMVMTKQPAPQEHNIVHL